MKERHVISLEVEDKPGVLSRISTLFSRRGFNVDSLTVGHTHVPGISRFTIVVRGDAEVLEQIRKQSQKLIQVLTATDLNPAESVMREFAIVKLAHSTKDEKGIEEAIEINEIVDFYGGRMLDSGHGQLIVEFSGSEKKIEKVFEQLQSYKVLESIRTGKLGMKIG